MEVNSIIISTVDREPEYIHQVLARLLFSLGSDKKNIYLMVDGPSYKHYSTYKDYCTIYLNEKNTDITFKSARDNYVRCLELSYFLGGLNLILEDDILLVNDWYDKIKGIELSNNEEWLLSLNCAQNFNSLRGYEEFKAMDIEGSRMVWNKPFGVIYKPDVLKFLIHMLKTYDLEIPHDIMMGGFLSYSTVKVYECVPSLTEHLGEHSSISKNIIWQKTLDNFGRVVGYKQIEKNNGNKLCNN